MWVREYGAPGILEYGIFPAVHRRCSEPSDEDIPNSFGSFSTIWPDAAGSCARVFFTFYSPMCIQKKKLDGAWHPGPSARRGKGVRGAHIPYTHVVSTLISRPKTASGLLF